MTPHTRPLGLADLPLMALAGRAPYANEAVTLEHGAASVRGRPGWERLLRNSIQPGGREVWISRDGLSLRGLAAVRPRGGASAWEIDVLVLGVQSEALTLDLLERCVATAGARGAHRLFLRLAAGNPALPAARRQGFAAAGSETLLVRSPEAGGDRDATAAGLGAVTAAAPAWRNRTRADDHDLFRLFGDTAPHDTRWQVALTPQEWRAAQDPLGRGGREWVCTGDAGPALLRVRRGEGRIRATLLSADRREPADAAVALLRRFAGAGSRGGGPRSTAEVLLPDHLPVVADAFRDHGYHDAARFDLSVRPIAQRTQRLQLAERSVEGTVWPAIQ